MNSLLHARLVISIFTVLWCTHSATAEWHFREHEIFGTNVSVQLWSENTTAANRAHENVAMEMWRIHNKLSPYIETSELALLNQNAYAEPLDVSDELATLIDKALFYRKLVRVLLISLSQVSGICSITAKQLNLLKGK